MQHKYNKYLALILCFAMVLALIPAASFADAGAAAASAPVVQKAKDLRKPTEKAAPEAARADTYLDTPLTLGTNTYDVGEGETVYRPFVPSEDGLYWFYSDCDEDTYGYLLDADYNELAYNDDGGNGANFSMRETLTGGAFTAAPSPVPSTSVLSSSMRPPAATICIGATTPHPAS